MNPFYFGTGRRRLFGLYTPGSGAGRMRAAVLCHPWGQEYIRAHRSMRQLSSMLTARGFHVLRFDYFGTGDSAGDMTQADVKGWREDIGMAIDELRDTTDATRVTLVGLRLGATLAATVAASRRTEVDELVLWDPVVSGEEYLCELLQRSGTVTARAGERGGGYEVLGFPLTGPMLAEFKAIDLLPLVPAIPARTLVIATAALASHQGLGSALANRPGMAPLIESIESQQPWLKARSGSGGAMPVNVLQRICQWLG